LAISRRLFDGKPSCLWVICATALVTVTVNPALGLILGWVAELIQLRTEPAKETTRSARPMVRRHSMA
jgi:hypothetical protein